jgi:hypothetical protein
MKDLKAVHAIDLET